MSKRLGYTWWPKDWAASQKVQSMNIIERGIYRELIDLIMDAEGAIPVNKTLWCRLWRISETDLNNALEYMQELGAIEFHGADLWIPSCEARLSVIMPQRENARENGAKGGRPRKPTNNPNETQRKPSGFTTEKKTETKTTTQTKTESAKSSPSGLSDLELINSFDIFWNAYGKKKEREKCLAIWQKLKIEDIKKIGEIVSVYVASTPDIQFRKHPLTWLRGKCWNDEFVIDEFIPQSGKYGTGFDGKPYKFTPDF